MRKAPQQTTGRKRTLLSRIGTVKVHELSRAFSGGGTCQNASIQSARKNSDDVRSGILPEMCPEHQNVMSVEQIHESLTCSLTQSASPTYLWSASTSHVRGCAHLPRPRTSSPRDAWQQPLPLHIRRKPPTESATLVRIQFLQRFSHCASGNCNPACAHCDIQLSAGHLQPECRHVLNVSPDFVFHCMWIATQASDPSTKLAGTCTNGCLIVDCSRQRESSWQTIFFNQLAALFVLGNIVCPSLLELRRKSDWTSL